jgi:hypothetical protein
MREMQWVTPEVVVQVRFVEWKPRRAGCGTRRSWVCAPTRTRERCAGSGARAPTKPTSTSVRSWYPPHSSDVLHKTFEIRSLPSLKSHSIYNGIELSTIRHESPLPSNFRVKWAADREPSTRNRRLVRSRAAPVLLPNPQNGRSRTDRTSPTASRTATDSVTRVRANAIASLRMPMR